MKHIRLNISVYDKIPDLTKCIICAKACGFDDIQICYPHDAPEDDIKTVAKNLSCKTIKINTSEYRITKNKKEFFKIITPRVWDTQRIGILNSIGKYKMIVHTHSDGWMINNNFKLFLEELTKKEFSMAYRGIGLGFKNWPHNPLGSVDDHFYIVNGNCSEINKFFSRTFEDFNIEGLNIHGILSILSYATLNSKGSIHYDDTKDWKNWDGSDRILKTCNPLRPFVYSGKFGLLHSHMEDFPNEICNLIRRQLINSQGLHSLQKDFLPLSDEENRILFEFQRNQKTIRRVLSFLFMENNTFGVIYNGSLFKNIFKYQNLRKVFLNIAMSCFRKSGLRIIEDERFK